MKLLVSNVISDVVSCQVVQNLGVCFEGNYNDTVDSGDGCLNKIKSSLFKLFWFALIFVSVIVSATPFHVVIAVPLTNQV